MSVAERRPLASRDTRAAQTAAHWLAVHGVTPNGISIAGMIAGVAAGCWLASTRIPGFEIAGFLLGAAGVQLRLLANMLDGMVAVEQNSTSPVGELYNEIPDRVSDVAILVGAGYALGGEVTLGFWAAILAVFIAYIRAQGKAAGAAHEFCGPMAKPQRMFTVTVAGLYAGLAPADWQFAHPAIPGCSTMAVGLAIILAGEVVTIFRRLSRVGGQLRGCS